MMKYMLVVFCWEAPFLLSLFPDVRCMADFQTSKDRPQAAHSSSGMLQGDDFDPTKGA